MAVKTESRVCRRLLAGMRELAGCGTTSMACNLQASYRSKAREVRRLGMIVRFNSIAPPTSSNAAFVKAHLSPSLLFFLASGPLPECLGVFRFHPVIDEDTNTNV